MREAATTDEVRFLPLSGTIRSYQDMTRVVVLGDDHAFGMITIAVTEAGEDLYYPYGYGIQFDLTPHEAQNLARALQAEAQAILGKRAAEGLEP